MMDKDFEMQGENHGPIVVKLSRTPGLSTQNDYSRERLADLLEGDLLSEAQDWYTIASITGMAKKRSFLLSIYNALSQKEFKTPSRAFTAAKLQAAIQFFTDRKIPLEHIEIWGKGIDPYLGNVADLDDF